MAIVQTTGKLLVHVYRNVCTLVMEGFRPQLRHGARVGILLYNVDRGRFWAATGAID